MKKDYLVVSSFSKCFLAAAMLSKVAADSKEVILVGIKNGDECKLTYIRI